MDKKELLERLRYIHEELSLENDPETCHFEADGALLEYINDVEIKQAFNNIEKWYS